MSKSSWQTSQLRGGPVPGLTRREAEIAEMPTRAPAGTLPCGCGRHLAAAGLRPRLPAARGYLCGRRGRGRVPAPRPAPPGTAGMAPPNLAAPLSPTFTFPCVSVAVGEGAVRGCKGFSLNGPVCLRCPPSCQCSLPRPDSAGGNFARFSEWGFRTGRSEIRFRVCPPLP